MKYRGYIIEGTKGFECNLLEADGKLICTFEYQTDAMEFVDHMLRLVAQYGHKVVPK